MGEAASAGLGRTGRKRKGGTYVVGEAKQDGETPETGDHDGQQGRLMVE